MRFVHWNATREYDTGIRHGNATRTPFSNHWNRQMNRLDAAGLFDDAASITGLVSYQSLTAGVSRRS